MRISIRFFVAVVLPVFAPFFAYPVVNVSGGLEESLAGTDLSALSALTVSGSMDARDFQLIREEMPNLSSLDISGVEITEYSDKKPLLGNYAGFDAGELPPFCLSGTKLQEVVLPASLVSVGDGAFAGCVELKSVDLPASVGEIGDMAFSGCRSLASVKGYGKLTRTGDFSFSRCISLSSVDLPALSVIGCHAFSQCSSLRSFGFAASLSQIGEGAFMGASLEKADLSGCGSLQTVGAWAFADNDALSEVVLPSGVESLGDGAFFYNTSLRRVQLPQGMVRINDFLFAGGKLMTDSGILPESLREIGDYALSDWRSITEIIIPENVEHIGSGAFRNQKSLYKIESLAAEPPALGEDVWANVDKSCVTLSVPENSEAGYRSAEQWRDFFNAASAVSSVESGLSVSVSDNTLVLESAVEIKEAALFDVSGVLLSLKEPRSQTADFYLGGYSANVYIVRCVLDGGKVETLKIARN